MPDDDADDRLDEMKDDDDDDGRLDENDRLDDDENDRLDEKPPERPNDAADATSVTNNRAANEAAIIFLFMY